MNNILLLGKNGQLGYEAYRVLMCLGKVVAVDYPEIDFTKPKDVIKFVDDQKPDLIFNAAAYTDVDRAEKEIGKAKLINTDTPGELGRYCRRFSIPLIHFSTDYVFDGNKNALYSENDRPNPQNIYGKTKLDGELEIIDSDCNYFIFRTSWVYSMGEGGFVKKVIDWAQKNEELRIVDDQIGNPTWSRNLAILSIVPIIRNLERLLTIFEQKKGIFHLAGGGYTSRFEWAKIIINNIKNEIPLKVQNILPAKTKDFPTPATRPLFSALDCSKFVNEFNLQIPTWEIAMKLMLEKPNK